MDHLLKQARGLMRVGILATVLTLPALGMGMALASSHAPSGWLDEWPNTDFSKQDVDYAEIISGGPPKDGIPAIDRPKFKPIANITNISDTEPAIVFSHNGQTKAYPLSIMMFHEIVNDTIGDMAIAVTYCPLCNAAIVFNALHNGQHLTFGTTGKLRNSDLVMYDRQSESWWQQFSGKAIVGEKTGEVLEMLPARIESFALIKNQYPNAQVLIADRGFARRAYGTNPYVGYDTSISPFLFMGELPKDINPMMRVVVVEGKAWTLPLLVKNKTIKFENLIIRWVAGQNSALDTRKIADGRDVGNISVQTLGKSGLVDVAHHVTFAFVFHAFHPDGQMFD